MDKCVCVCEGQNVYVFLVWISIVSQSTIRFGIIVKGQSSLKPLTEFQQWMKRKRKSKKKKIKQSSSIDDKESHKQNQTSHNWWWW